MATKRLKLKLAGKEPLKQFEATDIESVKLNFVNSMLPQNLKQLVTTTQTDAFFQN